jgi:hypothetical protein
VPVFEIPVENFRPTRGSGLITPITKRTACSRQLFSAVSKTSIFETLDPSGHSRLLARQENVKLDDVRIYA